MGFWFVAGAVGASFALRLLRGRPKVPGAADPRVNYRPRAASYGNVVPLGYGTTLVPAPAIVRGALEAQGDAWKQHQLALMLGQGPVAGVQAVWLSEGGERDPAKTTRIPWSRMVECGATLQAGTLDGHTPIGPAMTRPATDDITIVLDGQTGGAWHGRIKIAASSNRSFVPVLMNAPTVRLSNAGFFGWVEETQNFNGTPHRADGVFTVTSLAEKELSLSGVSVWASTMVIGKEYSLYTPYWIAPASGGLYYPGISFIRADPLDLAALYKGLDPSTTLTPSVEAETTWGIAGAGPDALDAEAADVLADLFGSAYWAANLGETLETDIGTGGTTASGFRTYCRATGRHVSIVFTEQRSAADLAQEVLDATHGVAVPFADKLAILPLGDEAVTANGFTYTPNTQPLYDLGPSDFLASGSQPAVTVEARPDALAHNVIAVEYRDRHAGGAAYRVAVETAFDAADIETQAAITGGTGKREASPLVLHGITSGAHARQIAHLRLQQARAVRNAQRFRAGWNKGRIWGMDLLTLTDPAQGLDHAPVRVIAVEGNELGERSITTIDWPIGTAGATRFTTQSSDTAAPVQVDPGAAEPPLVVPVPAYLAGQQPAVWIGATGRSEMYGGCDVHLSADNVAYSYVGTIRGRSAIGSLEAELATGSALDTVNTIAVDLAGSRGILAGTTAQGRDDLETLSWLDGELLAFKDATPATEAYRYTLASLRRGAHGTTIASHAARSSFLRLDSTVLRVALPESRFGVPLYVKLVPFNVYGGGKPDLSAVTAHQVTVALQAPTSPATCLLSVLTSPPAPATNQWRASATELLHGRWARVQWTMAEGLADGFEVALYTGTDPDDASKYVVPLQAVAANIRDAVLAVSAGASALTVRAAVRAIHAGGVPSPWRTSASDVIDANTLAFPSRDELASAFDLNGHQVFYSATAPQSGMVAEDFWFKETTLADGRIHYAPYQFDGAVWVPLGAQMQVASALAAGIVGAREARVDELRAQILIAQQITTGMLRMNYGANLFPNGKSRVAPPSGAGQAILDSAEFRYRHESSPGVWVRRMSAGQTLSVRYDVALYQAFRANAGIAAAGGSARLRLDRYAADGSNNPLYSSTVTGTTADALIPSDGSAAVVLTGGVVEVGLTLEVLSGTVDFSSVDFFAVMVGGDGLGVDASKVTITRQAGAVTGVALRDTGWIYPTLNAGFTNYFSGPYAGSGFVSPATRYRKLAGVVHVQIAVSHSSGVTIFTLPEGYRPNQVGLTGVDLSYFSVVAGAQSLEVLSNGEVRLSVAGTGNPKIFNFCFPADA